MCSNLPIKAANKRYVLFTNDKQSSTDHKHSDYDSFDVDDIIKLEMSQIRVEIRSR